MFDLAGVAEFFNSAALLAICRAKRPGRAGGDRFFVVLDAAAVRRCTRATT